MISRTVAADILLKQRPRASTVAGAAYTKQSSSTEPALYHALLRRMYSLVLLKGNEGKDRRLLTIMRELAP